MIIIPAIDLIDGTCVRLTQGDYSTSEKVAEDPVETAKRFESDGAEWLHMVDLDGAKSGKPENMEVIKKVLDATSLKIEIGGGIRNSTNITDYINLGVSRIILGSIAISEPEIVKDAVKKYGDKIAVGIDAKKGMVKAGGWILNSDVYFVDLAIEMDKAGVDNIIYTDISKDGTLSGPNLDELREINDAVNANITASGGVKDISDIKSLYEIGVYGVICGKSIYQNTLNLREAIDLASRYSD